MTEIPLGPFVLIEPIGRGGMGEVWRGIHRLQQLPVAIKMLTDSASRDQRFLASFRNEVRAAAGLDHPHVVLVLDYGATTTEASALSGGRFVAGTPYLVTELLTGGSLRRQLARDTSWLTARETLLCLLDALAHAHARGMVHLDLKPDNILFGSPQDARPGLKLTDFGLAHAFARKDVGERGLIAGTPTYMAPEQFSDRWRDYGPWTDLYALGVLAWTLFSGSPPFPETEYGALQQAHLWAEPPRLILRMAAPAGVEKWVRRLLEKDPARRFQRAADAAWALLSLGDAPDLIVDLGQDFLDRAPGVSSPQHTAIQALLTLTTTAPRPHGDLLPEEEWLEVPYDGPVMPMAPAVLTDPGDEENAVDEPTSLIFASAPPMPDDWEVPAPPVPSLRLLGAGLSLYWLRALPLVDRASERDALWDALWEVRELRQTRAVILRGSHGCGKSRLAEWLCERAHEVGAAIWMRATHSPATGSGDGLGPMLARMLRCSNLNRTRVEMRLRALLPRYGMPEDEALPLTELLKPATEAERRSGINAYSFTKPLERFAVIRRFIEHIARERPIVLWIDDAQWGSDALRFALYLLDERRRSALPVLVLATVREEAIQQRPDEARLLAQLQGRLTVQTIEVGPLPAEHRGALVRELLGLETTLAQEVAERTGGNPLFAVQLVGDWVHRGVLEIGEAGFRLREGLQVELPEDLHSVWTWRIDQVLEGGAPSDVRALELAAVLGQDVSSQEWLALCESEGIEAPWGLVDRLLSARLARCPDSTPEVGWSFVHGMLRESLERRAREAGRLSLHHQAAARMLLKLDAFGIAERVGRHLLAAGDAITAERYLLLGARERRASGDYGLGEALLAERQEALNAAGLPPEDERWGLGWVLESRLALLRGGARDQAEELAVRAENAARRYGWSLVLALALRERAKLANTTGDHARGLRWAREAAQVAERLGDQGLLARCRMDTGDLLISRGSLSEAVEVYREAIREFQALGLETDVATARRSIGLAAYQGGNYEEGAREIGAALRQYERQGLRWSIGFCQNALGDIRRGQGDFESAELAYQQAIACYRSVESNEIVIPMINLGLGYGDQGRYAEARPVLEEGLENVRAQGRRGIEGCVRICLLPALGALGDWAAWDRHFYEGERLLEETGFVEIDIARMAEKAGEIAAAHGDFTRARQAWALAQVQYWALDREQDAARIEGRVHALDPIAQAG